MPYRLKKPIFFFDGLIRKLKRNFAKLSLKRIRQVILGKTLWVRALILIYMFIQVPAGISAVKKQHCLIHLKEKGEYPALSRHFLQSAVYLANQLLLTMLKHSAGYHI